MMVNQTGEVKSYDDYYPFGMTMSGRSSVTIEPKYRFTGKEMSEATRHYLFGARTYNSLIGKWDQVDPLNEKFPSYTSYNYCLNNPLTVFDPDGAWPFYIHNYMLKEAFGNVVDNNTLNSLMMASSFTDAEFQDFQYSYLHAMSDGIVGQTRAEAAKLFNGFINNLNINSNPKTGEMLEKDTDLGMRLHALMDFTCPPHEGFQPWAIGLSNVLGFIPNILGGIRYVLNHGQWEFDLEDVYSHFTNIEYSKRLESTVNIIRAFMNAYQTGSNFDVRTINANGWSTSQINSEVDFWKAQGYIVLVNGVQQ